MTIIRYLYLRMLLKQHERILRRIANERINGEYFDAHEDAYFRMQRNACISAIAELRARNNRLYSFGEII